MQITSAMKMVSAAKLKKAQEAITAMRPYANKLTELIQNLSGSLDGEGQNPYTDQRAVEKILIIAVTSNRGLCGAFNTNIIKETFRLVNEDFAGKAVEDMGFIALVAGLAFLQLDRQNARELKHRKIRFAIRFVRKSTT